ncbi:hypothetical protein Tco_0869146 [Tanacetum coccineum]
MTNQDSRTGSRRSRASYTASALTRRLPETTVAGNSQCQDCWSMMRAYECHGKQIAKKDDNRQILPKR